MGCCGLYRKAVDRWARPPVEPRIACRARWAVRVLAFVAVGLCPGLAQISQAATFTVDRTDDNASAAACDDATPNDCSLRGAIITANARAGADTINLPAGTYALTVSGAGEDAAARGDLDITDDLTLNGAGADATVISGVSGDRVIHVDPRGALIKVTISGVTVQNGSPIVISFVSPRGGGILVGTTQTLGTTVPSGKLTLSDCVIQNNSTERLGGGVATLGGTLVIVRSRIIGNQAQQGGGIGNDASGATTLVDSTVRDNVAQSGAGIAGFGAQVTVVGSTISGNVGGGVYMPAGSLELTDSTVSGNSTGLFLYNEGGGPHTLNSSTIVNNSGAGISTSNSGVGTHPVTLSNTIVANNAGPDCVATLLSGGHNLVRNIFPVVPNSPPVCFFAGDTTGNIIGQDPRLGPLADNGGPTATHALLAGSPAIDAGSPLAAGSGGHACAGTDQRSIVRQQGAACDVGAYEATGGFFVTDAKPDRGGADGSVTAVIFGSGFDPAASVTLTRPGEADIPGNPVTFAGASVIGATFDLAGRSLGAWDVVVRNPQGSAVLARGFTIEDPRRPVLWVQIVGRSDIRTGATERYVALFGNRGNSDARGVPLSLSFPGDAALGLVTAIAPPPLQPEQVLIDWGTVPLEVGPDAGPGGMHSIPLLLPLVPAGYIGAIEFTVSTPPSEDDTAQDELAAGIAPPLFAPGLDGQDLAGLLADAKSYAETNLGVVVPEEMLPDLEAYLRAQLGMAIDAGHDSWVATVGTRMKVYSLAQMIIDAAEFAAARVRAAQSVSVSELPAPGFLPWLSGVLPFGATAAWADWLCDECGNCKVCEPAKPCKPNGCSCKQKPSCTPGGHPPPTATPQPSAGPQGTPPSPPTPPPAPCPKPLVRAPDGRCVPLHCLPSKNPLLALLDDCDGRFRRRRRSHDPNDKSGTVGVTSEQFISGAKPLGYVIHFENQAGATAPAQAVVVTDQLDTTAFALDTFRLGPITIGADVLHPTSAASSYVGGADFRPDEPLLVPITAGVDPATGIAEWRFDTLDPLTLQLPDDPLVGFLPPNVKPPDGEGSVSFTVGLRAGLPTGTRICNQASIVFDVNTPIDTVPHCNTLDVTPPHSRVLPLPAAQTQTSFLLQWEGMDDGAGIADFTVYVSEDSGPFVPLVSDTPDTSVMFTGQVGKGYAFCSLSRDRVGMVEEKACPPEVDAMTTIVLADVPTDTPAEISTPTHTPTASQTPAPTNTATETPTGTPTDTAAATPTNTPAPTATPTATRADTPTQTPSHTPTSTRPATPTTTATAMPTAVATHAPGCGDVDGDGRVTLWDVLAEVLALRFGRSDARFDVNQDGRVSLVDLMVIATQLGRSC